MEKIKTDSYFVTICRFNGKKFIQRRKRKGLHAYPRILTLKEINKYLSKTDIKYPKLLRNGFKFVYEEYIEPRGAGGLSFELIFTDSNQNTKVIVAGFGIQVENTKYGYHFVDGVKVLNEILIQALQIEE